MFSNGPHEDPSAQRDLRRIQANQNHFLVRRRRWRKRQGRAEGRRREGRRRARSCNLKQASTQVDPSPLRSKQSSDRHQPNLCTLLCLLIQSRRPLSEHRDAMPGDPSRCAWICSWLGVAPLFKVVAILWAVGFVAFTTVVSAQSFIAVHMDAAGGEHGDRRALSLPAAHLHH